MEHIDFIKKFPVRALLLAVSAISAGLLVAALIAQYGFGLHPCELCMLQRYPYALIVALGVTGVVFIKAERALRTIAWLCAVLFFADAAIAAYHAGVEMGLFPGPTACSSAASQGETLEDMRRAIMNAPLVSCDQAMVHILGLSMAAWNAIAATLLAVGSIIYLRKTS